MVLSCGGGAWWMWAGHCKRGLSVGYCGGLAEIAVVVRSNSVGCWGRTRCGEAGRRCTGARPPGRGLGAAALLPVGTRRARVDAGWRGGGVQCTLSHSKELWVAITSQ